MLSIERRNCKIRIVKAFIRLEPDDILQLRLEPELNGAFIRLEPDEIMQLRLEPELNGGHFILV